MKDSIQKRLRQAKRRIERRLEGAREDRGRPMLGAANLRYELAEKMRGMGCGGIGLMQQLAQETGLVDTRAGPFGCARAGTITNGKTNQRPN